MEGYPDIETYISDLNALIHGHQMKMAATFGQLLNHSSLHPNAVTKIYATGTKKLDIIFIAKLDIRVDEEIVWDYGKNYTGVNPCVTSRFKCKTVKK